MATVGANIRYSDISTLISNVSTAYYRTKGSSWSSSIRQGGLLRYSDLSAINTAGQAIDAAYVSGVSGNGNTTFASNRGHTTRNGHDSYGRFTNNKCGGEFFLWRVDIGLQ